MRMNPERWDSEPSREGASDQQWSLDDVLRRTQDSGQADDVLEVIEELRKKNPNAQPSEIDTMTYFVLVYLKRRYPDLPLKNEKVLTMASTIAQSLLEDPTAAERMRTLWSQSS
ncbi:hypothetical protein AB1L30_07480 [Bremerella sp. JC817]|uniref:hypothetical protein n=1 Tax=Bremerella sp. JC817 TaxID=3231756 RepID=UPI003458C846